MSERKLQEIRARVAENYRTRIAWAEWSRSDLDRALLLDEVDRLRAAVPQPAVTEEKR